MGAAVTAGLAGHAVEGDSGSAQPGGTVVGRCLNCGTVLSGQFCHGCGQRGHVHRTLHEIGHDLLHAIFHFDGKFWRTLPLLVWRPGNLTRRYIHGERASFISPLALFLFAVFLTYAVLATVGLGTDNANGFDATSAAERQTEINAVRNRMSRELAVIDEKIAAAEAKGASSAVLREERAALIRGAKLMKLVDEKADPNQISDKAERNFTVADMETGMPALDNLIKKANDNPGLLLYKMQNNAYKFAWALIPLSMPFLWLLYPFSRRFHMYDHFVFVTYSISFMLLFAISMRLFEVLFVETPALAWLTFLYPPLHIYWQIRGAYGSSRIGAALRTLLLLTFIIFILVGFLMLLFALGAMG